MQKAGIALLLLLLSFPILLYAQEEDDSEEEPSTDSEWDYYETEFYSVGDKAFIVSFGAVFPTVFLSNGNAITHNLTPPVGYTGLLAYTFFLGSNVFVGGEIQGMVLQTLSRNMLFVIPIGARVGYQFVLSKFEFPISIALGMTFHRYLDLGYYGFYMKGGGGLISGLTRTGHSGLMPVGAGTRNGPPKRMKTLTEISWMSCFPSVTIFNYKAEQMIKRILLILSVIAAILMFGTCNDSIFYTISKEVIPIEPRIKGGPTNFAVYENYMYVASGSKLFRYHRDKDDKEIWDEQIPQPGGRIRQLASTGSHLYALCHNDENPTGSTVLKRYDDSNLQWQEIKGDTNGYNTFQSIFSANSVLFIGAERNDFFAILRVDNDRIRWLMDTGQKAMLRGAEFYESDYFFCTEGHAKGGIYTCNASFLLSSEPIIPKTEGVQFTGIISLKNNVTAIDRKGNLYTVTAQGLSNIITSLGRESTGALTIWEGPNNTTLLLAGRSSLVEGYTYGYMELNITGNISSWIFSEPGENHPYSSIQDGNKELYISTIGKESVTHLFQTPYEVDAKMTLYASTQKNSVWSLKVRDGKLQWNAEK
jgi:hypothetical protein